LILDSGPDRDAVVSDNYQQRLLVDTVRLHSVHHPSQDRVGVLCLKDVALVTLGHQPFVVAPSGSVPAWRIACPGAVTISRDLPRMMGIEKVSESEWRLNAVEFEGREQSVDLQSSVVVYARQKPVDDVELGFGACVEIAPCPVDFGQIVRN
jgi:hypothetical protein